MGVKIMDFTKLNKNTFEKIEWNVDTKDFTFKKLSDFYKYGVTTVRVFGFFFTKSTEYGLQPVAIARNCFINLPKHKKDVISDMLKNADCVSAIKNGECSLKLREYKSKYGKTCYDFDFINTPQVLTETPKATDATPTTETTDATETTEKQPDIF